MEKNLKANLLSAKPLFPTLIPIYDDERYVEGQLEGSAISSQSILEQLVDCSIVELCSLCHGRDVISHGVV